MLNSLRALYTYRAFILGNIKRELKNQYQNSLLGRLWLILSPLAMILVYTLIFSNVMQARMGGYSNHFAYGMYLCAGILPWGYFTAVLQRTTDVFVQNANMIKKSYFPRIVLPFTILGMETVNFLITMGLFFAFLIFNGIMPWQTIAWFLPILIIQQALALSLGVFLGVLNAFFRDIGKLLSVVLQFWFWFTPIVYLKDIIPEQFRNIALTINPMFALIDSYQRIIMRNEAPIGSNLILPASCAIVMLILAYFIHKKLANELVDVL